RHHRRGDRERGRDIEEFAGSPLAHVQAYRSDRRLAVSAAIAGIAAGVLGGIAARVGAGAVATAPAAALAFALALGAGIAAVRRARAVALFALGGGFFLLPAAAVDDIRQVAAPGDGELLTLLDGGRLPGDDRDAVRGFGIDDQHGAAADRDDRLFAIAFDDKARALDHAYEERRFHREMTHVLDLGLHGHLAEMLGHGGERPGAGLVVDADLRVRAEFDDFLAALQRHPPAQRAHDAVLGHDG